MLSTSPTSIQRRRQLHRRQNSLEVPNLITPLPASQRRNHRRGLSLDQPSNTNNANGLGIQQLSTLQEHQQSVLETNLGQMEHHQTQHIMQDTQTLRPTQPGHRQLDNFTNQQQIYNHPQYQYMQMIQQQQQQVAGQSLAPPEQAIKNLQCQISAIMENYPQYAQMAQQCASPIMDMAQNMSFMQQHTTPVLLQGPNSPSGFLPTPPPTHKSTRVVRPVDAAPMPMQFQVPIVQIQHPMGQDVQLYQDAFGSEYCSSSYQSSLVDPLSPGHSPMKPASMRSMSMPTLFEDAAMGAQQGMMTDHQLLLAAAEDQQAYRQYYADSPMLHPLSPREAMLANLEVDASIEDTGISAEEVQAFISEQDPSDSKWTCLFPECGKKFGRKENIRSHVQTHLGDRQFKCNACGKCFVRQHDLKRHAKIHSGDKPHKCPCGNGFARQDALTRHRQRGVCEGALPGFERREVKRGRPRKNRPDMADRLEKSTRARQLDARRGSEDNYASSSCSPSSDPYTPTHLAEYESDNFGASADPETHLEAFLKTYQDTPPTSPLTAGTATHDFASQRDHVSPKAVSTAHSSPVMSRNSPATGGASQGETFSDSVFDWGAIEPQPPHPALITDAFSPGAASSSNGSDFDDCAFDSAFGSAKHGSDPTFESLLGLGGNEMYSHGLPTGMSANSDVFAAQMENWLSSH